MQATDNPLAVYTDFDVWENRFRQAYLLACGILMDWDVQSHDMILHAGVLDDNENDSDVQGIRK